MRFFMSSFRWEIPLVFLSFVWASLSITCPLDDKCLCIPGLTEYEFQCPYENSEFIIHFMENKEIMIDCIREDSQKFNVNLLPNITIHKIQKFEIRFCPLPETGFQNILDWFLTEEVKFLRYRIFPLENATLGKESFKGLSFLESLQVDKSGADLEQDVFVNTPNLISLELQQNNIRLKEDLFKHTPLLKHLDISENQIVDIPQGLFKSLIKLQDLHLWGNNLTQINDFTFQGLDNLQSLELSGNKIEYISNSAFRSVPSLVKLNLSRNKLEILPSLASLDKLEVLTLRSNSLTSINDNDLIGLKNLKRVDLSFNRIEILGDNIFYFNGQLEYVSLSGNRIVKLPRNLFDGLVNLEEVDLSYNKIIKIDSFVSLKKLKHLLLNNNSIIDITQQNFKNLDNLHDINLQGNKIRVVNDKTFYYGQHLTTIRLSYNEIRDIHIQTILKSNYKLKYLDLSHNHINSINAEDLKSFNNAVSIDLQYNNITTVHFQKVDVTISPRVLLSHNPLQCDCNNYDFIKYIKSEVRRRDNLLCDGPPKLRHALIKNVELEDVVCPSDRICPEKCSCSWRSYDKSLIVDCSKRSLEILPKIKLEESSMVFEEIEFHLEDNNLTELDCNPNVTKLYVSRNKIRKVIRFPPSLKILHLDHNEISHLDHQVLQNLQTSNLSVLGLESNPWSCDCDTGDFINFLRQNIDKMDVGKIRCFDNDLLLVNLNERDFCYHWSPIALCVFLVSIIFMLLSFSFQKKIKAWLITYMRSGRGGVQDYADKNQTF